MLRDDADLTLEDEDLRGEAGPGAGVARDPVDLTLMIPTGELVLMHEQGTLTDFPHAHPQRYALTAGTSLSIGSADDSDIRLALRAYVSPTHFRVEVTRVRQVWLHNESISGTFVNDELVDDKRVLAFDDKISFLELRHARAALGHIRFRQLPSGTLHQLCKVDARQPRWWMDWMLKPAILRSILAHLDADDLVNARLACRSFRDNSTPPALKLRAAYLRTCALAAYAWKALPAYRLGKAQLLWQDWQRGLDLRCASATIDLGGRRVLDATHSTALAQALHRLPELQTLNLKGNNYSRDEGFTELSRALHHLPRLHTLNLNNVHLHAEGIKALACALRLMPQLQTLQVHHGFAGGRKAGVLELARALRHLTQLQTLDLRDNEIGAEGGWTLANALCQLPQLHTLNLAATKLDDEGISAMDQALRSLPRSQTLGLLNDNNIGEKGIEAFAHVLRRLPQLRSLNLGNNRICAKGGAALANALHNVSELQTLNLMGTLLDAVGAAALAQALRHLPRLLTLNLSYNTLGDEGVSAVARELCHLPKLQTLDLSQSGLRDETGAAALARALRHVPALQTLKLSWNVLGDEGITALAQALQHLPQLKTLDLSHSVGASLRGSQVDSEAEGLLHDAWLSSAGQRGRDSQLLLSRADWAQPPDAPARAPAAALFENDADPAMAMVLKYVVDSSTTSETDNEDDEDEDKDDNEEDYREDDEDDEADGDKDDEDPGEDGFESETDGRTVHSEEY